MKRREVKSKGEKERYSQLNAEFQRIARRDKTLSCFFVLVSHWKKIETQTKPYGTELMEQTCEEIFNAFKILKEIRENSNMQKD